MILSIQLGIRNLHFNQQIKILLINSSLLNNEIHENWYVINESWLNYNILITAIKNTWLLHSVCWEPRFLELFGLLMCIGIRIGGECRLTPRVVLDRGLARDISCLLEGVTRLGRVARTRLTLREIGLLFCKTNCFQSH